MTQEKTSIIVSVYNRLNNLELCLQSLHHQHAAFDEVIITDDGSEDDVAGFLDARKGSYRFPVIYVRQSKKGFRLARCRNNGVRAAQGNYIIFVDQDIIGTHYYIDQYIRYKKRGFFQVAFPVWLTQEQTAAIEPKDIASGDFSAIVTREQKEYITHQYRKDSWYYIATRYLHLSRYKPKVRGGVFGLYRDDFIAVNGFDEGFTSWGHEDDELNRRLYKYGMYGRTVFLSDYPLHLYHPPAPRAQGGASHNLAYYESRKREIHRGIYTCPNGINNPQPD